MAGKEIRLDMTLIEGHANVLIRVGDDGKVAERVLYQGVDTRFFERLWAGMNIDEMPRVTPMICGVCSATHHVCSALAVDKVRGVEPPETAQNIRAMINLGIHLNNQALHLVVMGLPDFLPASEKRRSVFRLMASRPALAKTGLKIMELGHTVVAVFGGREVHPINAVSGGVARAPSEHEVKELREKFEKLKSDLETFKKEALNLLAESKEKISNYESGTEYMLAVVDSKTGGFTPLEGVAKVIDSKGNVVVEFRPEEYTKVIDEKVFDYTYVKMPVLRSKGYPQGGMRTGPLARVNIVKSYGVEEADELRDKLFEEWGRPATHPLLYHYARVVETIAVYELIQRALDEWDFWSTPLRNYTDSVRGEGVAMIEAPRGTLIHHYRAREDGATEYVNVITPTTFNAVAMENDLTKFFQGKNVAKMSDREIYAHAVAIVRPYDPCMACATHTVAEHQLGKILIVDKNLNVVREVKP
ncbi:Ni/Fe hydrogenase subunit alpha [Pyrolobus fumarii]|nr:Ni/Fe hydrogenase subunit alpha [Pyrolobus fumarii]